MSVKSESGSPLSTFNTWPSRRRICGLLLATLLALPAASPAVELPVSATAHDPSSGQLLYRESRASLFADGELQQMEVIFRGPQQQRLGRKRLDYTQSMIQPQLREEQQGGECAATLLKDGKRWTLNRRRAGSEREETRWPDVRHLTLIDEALISYLASHQAELAAGELGKISYIDLQLSRPARYRIEAKAVAGGRELEVELLDAGWWREPRVAQVLNFDAASGRLLRRRAPSTLPCSEGDAPMVILRYQY